MLNLIPPYRFVLKEVYFSRYLLKSHLVIKHQQTLRCVDLRQLSSFLKSFDDLFLQIEQPENMVLPRGVKRTPKVG